MQALTQEPRKQKRMKNRPKKMLRYTLSILPYLMYLHVKSALLLQQKVERKMYKIMLKYDLLERYLK